MIRIKYAIGYGATTRASNKVVSEKTLEVAFEDLNLDDDADDEEIRDALWKAVLDDIGRNASMDDVLDDAESTIMEVHEEMALVRSRRTSPRSGPNPATQMLQKALSSATGGKPIAPGAYVLHLQPDGNATIEPAPPEKPRKTLKRVPAKRRAR